MRVASSALHCTSSVQLRARATDAATASSTAEGSICSLCFMCTGLVEMNVWMRRRLAGFRASPARSMSLNPAASEPTHDGVLHLFRDGVDRLEIAVRSNRKSGLDDIHAHFVQKRGDLDFFLMRHGRAGRLFAVAQCGVENPYTVQFDRVLLIVLFRIRRHIPTVLPFRPRRCSRFRLTCPLSASRRSVHASPRGV